MMTIRSTLSLAALAAALVAGSALLAQHQGDGAAQAADMQGSAQAALRAAIAAPTRTPAYVARDRYRHPFETLSFFGVKPSDNVVEIWPSGGWYTEILAPYLAKGGGTYWATGMG